MTARIHVIGAGLAGLAAALRLAPHGREIFIHEAAPQAGGRCRSYFDATLGMVIDNGNHLLLSGNHAAQAFLREIGAEDRLVGPETADFAFIDFANGARWRLRPNDGPIPWWVLSSQRRVPDTRIRDYFAPLALLKAAKGTPIASFIGAPELLSALTDITSFSSGRATTYTLVLIFYILVVMAVVALCRRLQLALETRRLAA